MLYNIKITNKLLKKRSYNNKYIMIKFKKLQILLLIGFNSIGQTNLVDIPPTPEVASFLKYTQTPIDYSNGSANISIPIYQVRINNFSLPVEINYVSRGVKVEEEASSVGLGWTLNCGGLITRIVNDLPDDAINGILSNTYSIKNDMLYPNNCEEYKLFNEKDLNNDPISSFDFAPDVYIVNAPGLNTKFKFIQEENKFVFFPSDNLKLDYVLENKALKGFIVTNDKGTKYYFGKNKDLSKENVSYNDIGISDYEISNQSQFLQKNDERYYYITTWHLSEIVLPENRNIRFNYIESISENTITRLKEEVIENSNASSHKTVYSNNGSKNKYVSEILTDKELIKFNYTNDRLDLMGAKRLNNIEIFSKNNLNLIKGFEFDHSYFISPNDVQSEQFRIVCGSEAYFQTIFKRLKINSVKEYSYDKNVKSYLNPYVFSYNETALPFKFSFSQDYWGGYNGAQNTSLIAKAVKLELNRYWIYGENYNSDRSVDTNYSKACILEKIKYPTGTEIAFDYESNTASTLNYINDYATICKDYLRIFNVKNKSTNVNYHFYKNSSNLINNNFETYYEYNFTVKDVNDPLKFSINITGCGNLASFDCDYNILLIGDGVNEYFSSNIDIYKYLKDGNYKIRVYDTTENPDSNFEINISYGKDNDTENLNVGGLRIKKITTYERGNKVFEKQLKYLLEDNGVSTLSSGAIPSLPSYFNPFHTVTGSLDYKMFLSSKSFNSLENATYRKVQEFENNIKSTYEYSWINNIIYHDWTERNFKELYFLEPFSSSSANNDLCSNIYSRNLLANIYEINEWKFFHIQEPYIDHKRGKLLRTNFYKLQNNAYVLVKSEENQYEYINSPIALYSELNKIGSFNVLISVPFRNVIFRNSKKIINNYYSSGTISDEINYKYDNNSNLFEPIGIITKNSLGETLETKYSYAHEKGNQPMIAANMVSIPLQTETFNNGNLVSSQETIYQQNSATNNFILPTQVFGKKETQQTNELKLTYNSYDSKGNLTQYTPENGVPVSIIWGYNNTLVVAKVEGVAYSGIQSNLITAIQTATDSATGTEAQVITALNALRSNLPNAMVTTYTHKPLIGVSTITDPKGLTTTYIYDAFNRLQQVKDHQGNILSQNQYNYRPQ